MLFGKPIEKCSIEELLIAAGGADIIPILDEAKRRDEMVKNEPMNNPTPITLTGKYTTRSGLPVRIYAVDGEAHGAVYERGRWQVANWSPNGTHVRSEIDLIPAKRKAYVWVGFEGNPRASWEKVGDNCIEVEL